MFIFIITDPSMLTDMMKGNVTNVLPMILIGGWINWTFSGFVTSKRLRKYHDKTHLFSLIISKGKDLHLWIYVSKRMYRAYDLYCCSYE